MKKPVPPGQNALLHGRNAPDSGFKDLRVLNNLAVPIRFRASVTLDRISVALCAPAEIENQVVEFVTSSQANGFCTVETRRHRSGETQYRVLDLSLAH